MKIPLYIAVFTDSTGKYANIGPVNLKILLTPGGIFTVFQFFSFDQFF